MFSSHDQAAQRESLRKEAESMVVRILVIVTALILLTVSTLLDVSDRVMELVRTHAATPYGFMIVFAGFVAIDLILTYLVMVVVRRIRRTRKTKLSNS